MNSWNRISIDAAHSRKSRKSVKENQMTKLSCCCEFEFTSFGELKDFCYFACDFGVGQKVQPNALNGFCNAVMLLDEFGRVNFHYRNISDVEPLNSLHNVVFQDSNLD